MDDMEERLRAAIARRSEGYVPSADLPDRIDVRVRRRRLQRRVGLTAAAVTAAVIVVLLVSPGRNNEGSLRTAGQGRPTMTLPPSSSSSTTSGPTGGGQGSSTSSTTTTATTAPDGPTTPGVDATAGLTRRGFGPITAGMTLREAQTATGVAITPSTASATCTEASIEGLEGVVLLVEPAADPMEGIVRAVTGSVVPSAEGALVGQSRTELLAALGQPTGTASDPSGLGGEVLVFESEGYAYGALVVDDLVLGLQSGDPAWVQYSDGCP